VAEEGVSADVTQLLLRAREGDRSAIELLFPLVYEELRRIASRRQPRGRADPTLGATALVHEAYLKLFDRTRLELVDREHFFAVAAKAMRQIAVDHARGRASLKRGGDRRRVDLDSQLGGVDDRADEVLAIDQALGRLAEIDERLARVVELRFFAGLTEIEIAESLGRDERTVRRDWRKARALLHGLLSGDLEG
jgi:RNA polymerase sigma factor (TIGR02999 family)